MLISISAGEADCEVDTASENELQCVIQSEEKTYTVTNQGFDYSRLTCQFLVQAFN